MEPVKKNLYWILALIVAASLALTWYGHACGLLLTHDSHQYLAAAESFRTSFQFLGIDGTPYTYWPPLFPVVLSLLPSPQVTMAWINVVLVIGLFGMLYVTADKLLTNRFFVLSFLFFVFTGVHLQLISVFLWSELIFVVLLTAYLSALSAKDKKWWLVCVFGFLLCLQRNAGLFIVAGSSFWILLNQAESWSLRLRKAFSIFFICSSGLIAWNVYVSFFAGSTFRFYDHDFFGSAWHNFEFLATAMQRTFLPFSMGAPFLFVLASVVIAYVFRRELLRSTEAALLFWILAFYFGGMVIMFRFDVNDGDRYIAVVIPFTALLIWMAWERVTQTKDRWKQLAASSLLLAALVYPTARSVKNVLLWHQMSCSGVVDNK